MSSASGESSTSMSMSSVASTAGATATTAAGGTCVVVAPTFAAGSSAIPAAVAALTGAAGAETGTGNAAAAALPDPDPNGAATPAACVEDEDEDEDAPFCRDADFEDCCGVCRECPPLPPPPLERLRERSGVLDEACGLLVLPPMPPAKEPNLKVGAALCMLISDGRGIINVWPGAMSARSRAHCTRRSVKDRRPALVTPHSIGQSSSTLFCTS